MGHTKLGASAVALAGISYPGWSAALAGDCRSWATWLELQACTGFPGTVPALRRPSLLGLGPLIYAEATRHQRMLPQATDAAGQVKAMALNFSGETGMGPEQRIFHVTPLSRVAFGT